MIVHDRVTVWPLWWTPEFCADVRRAMDRGETQPAEIIADQPSVDDQVRRAWDVTIDAVTQAAVERSLMAARRRISAMTAVPLTGSVGVSFLRYPPGGHYRRHRDRDTAMAPETSGRHTSVVVFLNTADADIPGGFAGGALRLYGARNQKPLDVRPDAGTLVAFPSRMLHEVLPVISGVRDVVVDWWTSGNGGRAGDGRPSAGVRQSGRRGERPH